MEEKIKSPGSTKESLLGKAGTVVETVKEKLVENKDELLKKAKESELAGKAKEKLEEVKENLFGKK